MKKFGFHDLVLTGLMGVLGIAGAQEYSADLKAALIASPASGKTVDLMDGRVLTYRQLVELPVYERKAVLELSKKPSMRSNFQVWESTATIAKAEADSKAEIAKVEALDRNLAKIYAEGVWLTEQIAERVGQLIAIGKKLPPEIKASIERDLKTQYIIDGLKPETLSFLKSVLARPELFRDK